MLFVLERHLSVWEGRHLVKHSINVRRDTALPRAAQRVHLEENGAHKQVYHTAGQQFLRFCLVGTSNAVIDFGCLNVLLWLFPTTHFCEISQAQLVAEPPQDDQKDHIGRIFQEIEQRPCALVEEVFAG